MNRDNKIETFRIRLNEVNIQTHTKCTRRCQYCGFGLKRKVKRILMKQEVFEKCINDLSQINYNQALSLYLNNEPFLDKRLVDFIRLTYLTLPEAKIFLFTNGDLLDFNIVKKSFDAGLQLLRISIYEASNVKKMKQFQKHFGKSKIQLLLQYKPSTIKMFHNWGGTASNDNIKQSIPNSGCILPFRKAVVNAQGFVGLCCVDFFNDIKFENVLDRSLVDIFNNNIKLNKYRDVLRSGRKNIKICNNCSYPGNDYDVFNPQKGKYVHRLLSLFKRLIKA